jgi:hypothetical protein
MLLPPFCIDTKTFAKKHSLLPFDDIYIYFNESSKHAGFSDREGCVKKA